ncbi:MAG: hypothetical protein ABSA34_03005 [Candidatus Goldiibacteriota bacterium]
MKRFMTLFALSVFAQLLFISCTSPVGPGLPPSTATVVSTKVPPTQTPTVIPSAAATLTATAVATVKIPVNTPTATATPTPFLCPGAVVNYSTLAYGSTLAAGNYVITTQNAYIANYSGWAASGSPTPTPVTVDFSSQMVVGFYTQIGCQLPSWALTGITMNCNQDAITAAVLQKSTYCPGQAMCNVIAAPMTAWYIVDKSYLPIYLQTTSVNECNGTTTTSTALFSGTILE